MSPAVNFPPLPWPRRTWSPGASGAGQLSGSMALRLFPTFRLLPSPFLAFPRRGVSPVLIIGGAGPFRRNHRCPERPLRRALAREGRTIHRFLQPLQHLGANALGRLFDARLFQTERLLR